MPLVLCRVDDRLVHGQVVIGWGRPLAIDFVALVDAGVATSPWEQDLYRMAVPPDMEVRFANVEEAAVQLGAWEASERRGLLLTGDIETMAALHRASPGVVHRINLGGIHHRAGRRERLPYLYLTDEEVRALEALEADGAEVFAQDLPTSSPVDLRDIV